TYLAAIFQNLSRAHEVLTDPQLRKQYDTWLASGIYIPFDKWLAMRNQFHTAPELRIHADQVKQKLLLQTS
ncbi:uncharacterized protein DEA37_0008996, partial [Paragonimus westermani]